MARVREFKKTVEAEFARLIAQREELQAKIDEAERVLAPLEQTCLILRAKIEALATLLEVPAEITAEQWSKMSSSSNGSDEQ